MESSHSTTSRLSWGRSFPPFIVIYDDHHCDDDDPLRNPVFSRLKWPCRVSHTVPLRRELKDIFLLHYRYDTYDRWGRRITLFTPLGTSPRREQTRRRRRIKRLKMVLKQKERKKRERGAWEFDFQWGRLCCSVCWKIEPGGGSSRVDKDSFLLFIWNIFFPFNFLPL